MADIIQLLPDNIANQIAAGEVIQRPASAVKELMENAIDAGSNNIQLIIKNAGKALIQVVDNGSGMSETDARMAFEKHATSKIRKVDDLFAIRTKGFRGEAMASIAAIAQVELKTRETDQDVGTRILIEGSEVKKQEACQTAAGTSVAVKNLFYNVPARRNFLKSDAVETKHIFEEFQRIALAHPSVAFSLINNGHEVYHLREGNLKQRIVGLMGKNYAERLVPIEERSDNISVTGYIGKPQYAKKTRGDQYLFVNKRFIKSGYLNHAVFQAYSELISKDQFPFFCIFIDLDPKVIDVNVHPTKQEIKFEDEKLVYHFVHAGAKHSLAQFSLTPTLDFDRETGFDHLESFRTDLSKSKDNVSNLPPMPGRDYPQKSKLERDNVKNWRDLYDARQKAEQQESDDSLTLQSRWEQDDENGHRKAAAPPPIQMHQRYILTQIKSGFILIDQQSAHQRILYERYLQALNQNRGSTQRSLFPKTLELNPGDAELLKEVLQDVNSMGFDIQDFGNNSFVIQGFPSDIPEGDEMKLIEALIEQYKTHLKVERLDKRESLARAMASSSGIKGGKILSEPEMRRLIDELFACSTPYTTPGGKPTFITFDLTELATRFGRKS
jgi:DNA mismatch repair protein MutL